MSASIYLTEIKTSGTEILEINIFIYMIVRISELIITFSERMSRADKWSFL